MGMTKYAKGSPLKGGAVRRIAVTMSDVIFEAIQKRAVANDRSISAEIMRIIKREIKSDGYRKEVEDRRRQIARELTP